MDKYSVKILPKAATELDEIYAYICYSKLAPEVAKKQINRIKESIIDLGLFPKSLQERLEGCFAGKGYRQLLVDNYVVIFRIDENQKIVYVVTIQYYGRNI